MGKPVAIKDIVSALMKSQGETVRTLQGALLRDWAGIVGNVSSRHSRPVKFTNSVLVVCAENSCYVHDLTMRKREIISRIKERFPQQQIKDIRFKVGSVCEEMGKERKNV